nr:fibronectin type III domain-containing protein [Bacteroidales bacterium]
MKKFLLFLMFAMFCIPWAANAQTEVQIGDGTATSNQVPIGTYYNYSITEMLYTADEIGTAGTISSISFYYMGIAAKDLPITVYMQNVDAEDLSAGISLADADEVFSGTLSVTTTAGWVTINLDAPFAYDGTSNLLIGINKGYLYYFSGESWQGTATSATMARYTQSDSDGPYTTSTVPGSTTTTRPNIKMNITPSSAPVCAKPVAVTVGNVTPTSCEVYIEYSGTGISQNLRYKAASDADWTIVEGLSAMESSYLLSSLTPNSTYSVGVQTVCEDGTSGWTSASFSTPAGIPLIEAFGTSLPTGWAKYSGLLSGVQAGTEELVVPSYGGWYFGTNNGVFDNHAYVNIYGTSCKYWLVTPSLTMENNVQLLFDVAYTAFSGTATAPATDGTDDKFVVLINDGQGWSVLRQWDNAGSEFVLNNLGVTPTTVAIDLSSYAGQNIAIAFYGESTESNADNNLHIDNVSINYIPNCPVPTSLAASNVTAHTADFTWESNADSWQVCLDNDEANLNPVTTPTYTVTGLDGETQHTVKVRAICGSDFSDWTNPVTFTTLVACPVPTLAYSGAVTNLTAHSGTVNWTENGDATEWVVAYKVTSDTEADFEEITVTENPYTLENLTPETGYTVKVKAVCGGIDGESAWSATRTFTTTSACPAPTNLQCTGATTTTATLTWFEGEATQWEVCLNDDEENLYNVFDTPTITIENLAPGTTYSFKVRAICDSASAWSSSYSFTTSFVIPLVQPFDATSIPAGWNMYTGSLGADGTADLTSTTYGWTFGTSNGVFDSHARVNIYGTGCYNWLVTPYLEMEDNVRLTFDLALTAYSGTVAAPATTGTDDKFVVLITTDGGSTWEVLRQWDNAGSEYVYNNIACSAEGELVNLNLSSYAGETIAIAFYGESTVYNADNNLHIDNVTIEYIPSCEKPVALAVEYNGGTEATISWESDATSFNVDVNGTVTNNVTNPYTITGLELGTTYNVMVQANCGGDLSEWSNPVSFTTDLCMPENQCELTFEVTDSYGDTWNGNAIQVVDVLTGAVVGTITNDYDNYTATGSSGAYTQIKTLAVCDGRDINFVWVKGSYPGEASWVIKDVNGEEITSGAGSSSMATGDVIATYTVSCVISTCRKPTNFTASNVGSHSVDLSWVENGESDRWQIRYKVASDTVYSITPVNAGTNPFTLTGLHTETTYTAQVKPRCDVEKWSDEITFTTDVACPAPANLTVSDITATSATASWTGEASDYNLRYRKLTDADYATITFAPNDVWQDGTGYQLLLDADANAYGTIIPESGGLTTSGNASAAVYAEFEYKFPANADGAMNTQNVLIGESVTITVPAGTYDWCVTNPTPGDRIWIAGEGRADNYVIEGGNTYLFVVQSNGDGGDEVVVTVSEPEPVRDVVWTEINNVTSPYTLTVEPESDYVVEVQANCGEDGISSWASTSFSTPSNCQAPTPLDVTDITAYTATLNWTGLHDSYQVQYRTKGSRELLFSEDFDDQPSTWTLTNAAYNRTSSQTTDYFVYLGYESTETAYLITPDLTDIVSVGTVEFNQRSYNGDATFQVGFSSTTNDVDAFTWGEEVSAAGVFFTPYDVAMPAGTKYVAIKSTTSATDNYVFINDFGIYGNEIPAGEWNTATANTTSCTISSLVAATEYEWQVRGVTESCDGGYAEWSELVTFTTDVSCPVPTDLTISEVTGVSAVVSWTSDATSFDIEVNEIVTEGVTNPYTLENLDPATIYYVRVRANCGDGDYSEWSVPYAFVTDCGGAKDLPYTFGFEDVNEYYSCWGTYAEDGNENSLGISAYNAAYDGSNVFVFSSYTNYSTAYDQYLYSPELNAEGEVALEFYYRTLNGYGSGETFKVGYSTDGEEFIWGDEISTTDTTWTAYIDTLPAGTKYVAVHYYSNYQYYLVVDGFHLEEVVTTVTQTTALGAGANWFSSYVEITLDDLKAALVATGNTEITIQGQTQNTIYNPNNGRWTGQLRTLDLS